MHRDPRAWLWDVVQAADAIASFAEGLDGDAYVTNPMVRSAVERQFEIIGEARKSAARATPSPPPIAAPD